MIIGFTGTRNLNGITPARLSALSEFLLELNMTEFHYGDCIGADEFAFNIVTARNQTVEYTRVLRVSHPPINPKYRAFTEADETWTPKEYLVRNHDIVDQSNFLVALPKDPDKEELRSGTWATIRYAESLGWAQGWKIEVF